MPVVKDSYDNEAEAQVAADKLQAYTDESRRSQELNVISQPRAQEEAMSKILR